MPQAPQAWPPLAAFRLASSCCEMALISELFFSSSSRRFLGERKKSRMRSMSMVGHSHEQKARPNTSTSAAMSSSETTARGIMVLVAIMVPKAPRGHRSEMSCQPMADSVPTPTWVAKPTPMTPMTARGMIVRSRLVFAGAALLYDSRGRTMMARSVAPAEMEPFCSDTQTLSQAPQPLQASAIT